MVSSKSGYVYVSTRTKVPNRILNMRRDAEEIQVRLNAACQSSERQQHYDNITSDDGGDKDPLKIRFLQRRRY